MSRKSTKDIDLALVHSRVRFSNWWANVWPAVVLAGIYGDMLSVLDTGLANITKQLKGPGNKWSTTIIVVTSDNGGPTTTTGPNNYP